MLSARLWNIPEACGLVEKFKYLRAEFMINGKQETEFDVRTV